MAIKKEALWTKEFILLSLANLASIGSIYFLVPTVPKYAAAMLGASEFQVGLAVGITSVAAMLTRPFSGYFLDSFNKKYVYIISLIGITLVILTYNLAATLPLLIVIRVAHGMSTGTVSTSGITIVGEMLPPARRGEGVGFYGLSISLAMAIGPLIGVGLISGNNYHLMFTVAAGIALLSIILVSMVRLPKSKVQKRSFTWNNLLELKVMPLFVLMLFTYFAYGGIMAFITIYGDEIGYHNAGGVFFMVNAIALAVSRPLCGRLFDREGPKKVLNASFVFMLAGYLVLAGSKNLWGIVGAAALIGLGNGLCQPSLFTMVLGMVERERFGVGNSTLYIALDLGLAMGSMILGFIASRTSLSTVFILNGVLMIIPLFYLNIKVLKSYNKQIAGGTING